MMDHRITDLQSAIPAAIPYESYVDQIMGAVQFHFSNDTDDNDNNLMMIQTRPQFMGR